MDKIHKDKKALSSFQPVTDAAGSVAKLKLGGGLSANHKSKIHKSRIKNKPVHFG